MSSNTILQEAILRAASLREPKLNESSSQPPSDGEDNVLTRVHSPITSPTEQSRSTSPTRGTNSRNQSRAGLRARRELALREKRSSRDPLKRFPTDVMVRIFTIVGLGSDGYGGNLDGLTFSAAKDLLNCGLVCQKWRKSQAINYVWYKLCKHHTYSDSIEKEYEPLSWTKRDSQTSWPLKYKKMNQIKPNQVVKSDNIIQFSKIVPVDNTGHKSSKGVEESLGTRELNEKKWKQELDAKTSKAEARAYYKEFGGKKLKVKGGGIDKTGWEEREYFE
ncbi:hypothetical protein PPACK8108_LOCUS2559 [Phakopsora pachyrhizi]|uniref:F-box domain-containing protein n=1 Tax=Phakopsora pachyrhizi TaxID=170000 RepID=A0AAV0AIM4_PHAPC|nr:hypothetical protein PPACK8108_LOCUS2559 [Phakopsora pachyrhizi]